MSITHADVDTVPPSQEIVTFDRISHAFDTMSQSSTTSVPMSQIDVPISQSTVPISRSDVSMPQSDVPRTLLDVPTSHPEVPTSQSSVPISQSTVPTSQSEDEYIAINCQYYQHQPIDSLYHTQLQHLTLQNSTLLNTIESQQLHQEHCESQHSILQSHLITSQSQLADLQKTLDAQSDLADRHTQDLQSLTDLNRLLQLENQQLLHSNTELSLKSHIEMTNARENIQTLKAKQLQLSEKLHYSDQLSSRNKSQFLALQEKYQKLQSQFLEKSTQLELENALSRSQMENCKSLSNELKQSKIVKQSLEQKFDRMQSEKLIYDNENRQNMDQLREMAEKIFQLLERVKISEQAKQRAMDSVKHKENELATANKSNSRLSNQISVLEKSRAKLERENASAANEVLAARKMCSQLTLRCNEEGKSRLKAEEENLALQEKLKVQGFRIVMLTEKIQAEEHGKLVAKEEARAHLAQCVAMQDRAGEMTKQMHALQNQILILKECLRSEKNRVEALEVVLSKKSEEAESESEWNQKGTDTVSRYVLVQIPVSGKRIWVLKAKKEGSDSTQHASNAWLERWHVNAFLSHCQTQKAEKSVCLYIQKLAEILSLFMMKDEGYIEIERECGERRDEMIQLVKDRWAIEKKVQVEVQAKRKLLVRYVHLFLHRLDRTLEEKYGRTLELTDCEIGDEEVHAIAHLMQSQTVVKGLALSRNRIANDGACAIAALIGQNGCELEFVDLRENRISQKGIEVVVDALAHREEVKHVSLLGSGRVEALGTLSPSSANELSRDVELVTMCVVDMRDNSSVSSSNVDSKSENEQRSSEIAPIDQVRSKQPLSPSNLKKEQVRLKMRERQKNAKEAGWIGRAGGLQTSPLKEGNNMHKKQLPPLLLTGVEPLSPNPRTQFAPTLRRTREDTSKSTEGSENALIMVDKIG